MVASGATVSLSLLIENNGPTAYSGKFHVRIWQDDREAIYPLTVTQNGQAVATRTIEFDIELPQPLLPNTRAQVDLDDAAARRSLSMRVARDVAASDVQLLETLELTLSSTAETRGFTPWTFASQVSLRTDRLVARLQMPDGDLHCNRVMMRQPVEVPLLFPFSRTLSEFDGTPRRLWRTADVAKGPNLLVFFNIASQNLVSYTVKLTLAELGTYSMLAVILYDEQSGAFATLYRGGNMAGAGAEQQHWFVVPQPIGANEAVAQGEITVLKQDEFRQQMHCNAHHIVQVWYSKVQGEAPNAAIVQGTRERNAILQQLDAGADIEPPPILSQAVNSIRVAAQPWQSHIINIPAEET
jgi:hypothetical protein